MSQMDLHKTTGVGLRTIGRIEAGQAENSDSLGLLEDYFGIGDSSPTQDPATRPEGEVPPEPTLARVMELLAEAMRLVAQVEARTGGYVSGDRQVRWPASAAPSAQRKHGTDQTEHSREVQ